MTVLIVSQFGPQFSGATGTIVRALSSELAAQGHAVTVAYHPANGLHVGDKPDARVSLLSLGPRAGRMTRRCGLEIPVCFLKSPRTVARLVRHIRRCKPDFVLAIYPIEDVVFSALLACRLTAVPIFTWFHDLYLGAATGWRKKLAALLEPAFIRAAALNLCISTAVQDWYEARRPGAWGTLRHPIPCEEIAARRGGEPAGGRSILFCGAIYENCESNISELVRAVSAKPDARLEIVTPNVGTARQIVEKAETAASGRIAAGYATTRSSVLDRLFAADVLYLPLTFNGDLPADELNTMFPTKTVEYLMTGKTILVHAPAETYLVEFMRKQPGTVVCTQRGGEALESALEQAFALARARSSHDGRHGLEYFAPASVVASLCGAATLRFGSARGEV